MKNFFFLFWALTISVNAFAFGGISKPQLDARAAWLDAREYTTLTLAKNAAITNTAPLHISKNYNITTDTDLSAVPEIDFIGAGSFTVSNGVTLTLPPKIYAGHHSYILKGTGAVLIGSWSTGQAEVFVDWFGAKPDFAGISAGVNTGTDSSAAIVKALSAIPSANIQSAKISFNSGTYNCKMTGIVISKPVHIEGNGATLRWDDAFTGYGLDIKTAGGGSIIKDIKIMKEPYFGTTTAASRTGVGVRFDSTQKWATYDLAVQGWGTGVTHYGITGGTSYGDHFKPRVMFNAVGMHFDSSDSEGAYCSGITVHGGEVTAYGWTDYSAAYNVIVAQTNTHHTNNGIQFIGVVLEGKGTTTNVHRKVYDAGQHNSYINCYWDYTNSGTDVEFAASSSYNSVINGANLNGIVILDNGSNNSVSGPGTGIVAAAGISGVGFKIATSYITQQHGIAAPSGSASGNVYRAVYSGLMVSENSVVDFPAGKAGIIHISAGDEYGIFNVKTDGTITKISGSTNIDSAATSGKFCVYKNGTNARLYNRLAGNVTVLATFDFI